MSYVDYCIDDWNKIWSIPDSDALKRINEKLKSPRLNILVITVSMTNDLFSFNKLVYFQG